MLHNLHQMHRLKGIRAACSADTLLDLSRVSEKEGEEEEKSGGAEGA